jgi:hypothetical protein
MCRLLTILPALSFQFAFSVCAADLSDALNPDLHSAEEHIILGPSGFITQNGSNNTSYIFQKSASNGNFANVIQNGSNNYSIVSQSGELNFLSLNQLGNDNLAVSSQTGFIFLQWPHQSA